MKRLCLAPIFLAAIGLAFCQQAQAANLLNNAGFEDPLGFDFADTSNWNGFFGGPAGTFLEGFNDTGAPPFAGAQALELTIEAGDDMGMPVNGTNAFVGHAQSVTGVSAGDPLVLSVWARNNGSGLTADTEVRMEFLGTGGEISRTQENLTSVLTDEYEQYTVEAVVPDGTTSVNVVIALASFNQDVPHSHSVLFDNASLTVIPEPTTFGLLGVAGAALLSARRRR